MAKAIESEQVQTTVTRKQAGLIASALEIIDPDSDTGWEFADVEALAEHFRLIADGTLS